MKEQWDNINELNESLGDDFDVVAGWEDFSKKREKKRPVVWWWLGGGLSLVGIVLLVVLFGSQKKTPSKDTSVKVDKDFLEKGQPMNQSVYAIQSPAIVEQATTTLGKNATDNSLNVTIIEGQKIYPTKATKAAQIDQNNFAKKAVPTSYFIKESKAVTSVNGVTESPKYPIKNIGKQLKLRQKSRITPYLHTALKPIKFTHTVPDFKREYLPPTTKQTPSSNPFWSVGLTYGYHLPQRKLKEADINYQTLRQAGEQFLEQQQVAFSISRSLNQYLFLQSGLSYQRYRSRLVEQIQTLQSPVAFENVLIETQTQNNITTEIKGTAIGSQLNINQSTRYQLYQSLAIPIQIGIQVSIAKDWQVVMSSGIAFSVWQSAKGNTYATTLPDGQFTPVAALGYRSIGTIESLTQLTLQKRLTEHLSFTVGGQIQFDWNSRMNNQLSRTDNWSSYGINIGLKSNF